MKININIVKDIPKYIGKEIPYAYCVYGNPTDEFKAWLEFHKIPHETFDNYTNFYFPEDLNLADCFNSGESFTYVDGFSPNLNKHLHLGHLSNFVLAKSFQSMGIGEIYIAHLGDTLDGEIPKMEALKAYMELCLKYGYKVDRVFFASDMVTGSWLEDGEGDYAGCKVFDLGDQRIVGVKSDGSTSYFLQDVALAERLNKKTLYMTGAEQSGHFKALQYFFPDIKHLPLGLVTLDGEKMSSRKGNVIWLTEVFDIMKETFGDNENLIWNVVCGYILKSNPSSDKDIAVKDLQNVKSSFGLYLSYTLAKLSKAGLLFFKNEKFHSQKMEFAYLKAKFLLEPNILLKELVNTAKELSGLYEKYKIKDCPENHDFFIPMAEDLLTGMLLIGMKDVYKV